MERQIRYVIVDIISKIFYHHAPYSELTKFYKILEKMENDFIPLIIDEVLNYNPGNTTLYRFIYSPDGREYIHDLMDETMISHLFKDTEN